MGFPRVKESVLRIEVHRITSCGFYRRGSFASCFGGLNSFLDELETWIQTRSNVAATATFTDPENIPERVLCSCFVRLSGQGVGMALWYCSPSTEQGVAYIPMDEKPGEIEAAEQRLPTNSIAGWPRYFWIEPEQSIVTALIPSGAVTTAGSGLPSARSYLESYLSYFSSHVVREETSANPSTQENTIKGYRNNENEPPDKTVVPKFKTQPITLPGPIDEIRQQRENIRKFVSTTKISRHMPDVREKWEKAMQYLGWDAFKPPQDDNISFRLETAWQPGENDLEEVIEKWRQRSREINERAGVRLKGGSGVLWFDRTKCADEIEIDDELENALHWRPRQIEQVIRMAEPQVRQLIASANR
jgi:hypothetical protein